MKVLNKLLIFISLSCLFGVEVFASGPGNWQSTAMIVVDIVFYLMLVLSVGAIIYLIARKYRKKNRTVDF